MTSVQLQRTHLKRRQRSTNAQSSTRNVAKRILNRNDLGQRGFIRLHDAMFHRLNLPLENSEVFSPRCTARTASLAIPSDAAELANTCMFHCLESKHLASIHANISIQPISFVRLEFKNSGQSVEMLTHASPVERSPAAPRSSLSTAMSVEMHLPPISHMNICLYRRTSLAAEMHFIRHRSKVFLTGNPF